MTGMDYSQRYSYHVDPEADTTANKVLRLVGEERHVLELGPATGSMTRALSELNRCTVVAVEVDETMAEQARPFCQRMVIGDLERLDWEATFGEERFDVIIAADVLEHLNDPWTCLLAMRGLLRPEGCIVLSIPNIANGAVLGQLIRGRFPYQEKGLLDRTHLRFFTRHDLLDMLLSTGFLPTVWDRNRVYPADSEFGWQWQGLPTAVQQALAGMADADTYQFIVKAVPSTEAGWVSSTREAMARSDDEQARLLREFAEMQRRMEEYQQAYQEASRVGEEYRQYADQQRQAYETVSQQLAEWQSAHEALSGAMPQLTRERDDYLKAYQEYHQAYLDASKMLKEAQNTNSMLAEDNRWLRERWQSLARRLPVRLVNQLRSWLGKPPYFQA